MKKRYSISDYDKQLTLKVELGLWLTMLFLLRPFVIPILSIVNINDRMELINFVYPDKLDMVLTTIAAIPAGFVIYAFINKKSEASDFIRKVWRNGRYILIVSAVMNIAIIFVPLLLEVKHKIDMISWLQLTVSAAIIVYLRFSQRVRDTFLDFPESQPID